MNATPFIEYPYGHITWSNGCATVTHHETGCIYSEYLTDYQSRIGYPRQHLSGEYALQLLFADGSMGFNPQLTAWECVGDALVLTLEDSRHADIRLTLQLQLHAEGVFTQRATLRNGTGAPLQLLRAYSATASLQGNSYHATTFRGVWAGEHTMQEEEVKRGNTLCANACTGIKVAQEGTPGILIATDSPAHEEHGHCLTAALAWSGNYTLAFTHNAQGQGFLGLGHDFAQSPYTLAPGQELELPQAVLLNSIAGKGDATRRLHRYMRRCVIPRGQQTRDCLLNSWEGVHFDVHEPTLREMMQRTAALGIEMFVLDDGWFGQRKDDHSSLGDWYPDPDKLPEGLKPLTDYAAAQGLKFGLWIEPEMICPDSDLYRAHPDWALQLPGIVPTEQRYQLVLNLARPDVADYVLQTVSDLLNNNPGIAYVKWDSNRMMTDVPHTNIYFDYINAYYRIMRELRQRHPSVVFQCCSAGGGRRDLGAAQFHEEFWLSDNTDAHDRLRMQWSATHFFPANAVGAHVTASPNLYTGRRTSLKFRFDVALAGRLGFELDPRTLSADEEAEIRTRLVLAKELRPLVQLGDLYRLVSPYEGPDCALLYTDGQQTLLLAYTTERAFTHQHTRIPLKGLQADKLYTVEELLPDTPKCLCPQAGTQLTGAELMSNGLTICWNRPLQSVCIRFSETQI